MGVVADYDLKLRVSRPLSQYGNAQRLQTVVDCDSLRQANPVALRALDQRRRREIVEKFDRPVDVLLGLGVLDVRVGGDQLVAQGFGSCSAVGGALICG